MVARAELVQATQNGSTQPLHVKLPPCSTCDFDDLEDPLNSAKAAKQLRGSHFEEVKRMVERFNRVDSVNLEGQNLQVADVVAVARSQESVKVELNAASARPRVEDSAAWVQAVRELGFLLRRAE